MGCGGDRRRQCRCWGVSESHCISRAWLATHGSLVLRMSPRGGPNGARGRLLVKRKESQAVPATLPAPQNHPPCRLLLQGEWVYVLPSPLPRTPPRSLPDRGCQARQDGLTTLSLAMPFSPPTADLSANPAFNTPKDIPIPCSVPNPSD